MRPGPEHPVHPGAAIGRGARYTPEPGLPPIARWVLGLCLALGSGPAWARPTPEGEPTARLSGALAEAWRQRASTALDVRLPRFAAGARVVVESDEELDAAALAAAGAVVETHAGGLWQVWVPLDDLPALAALPGVRHLREPAQAEGKTEESEGHAATGASAWAEAGWTGVGVDVVIVDVGFVDYEALVGNELPAELSTDFERGAAGSSAHGTAVAEVIADLAPNAGVHLVSFSTDVEFVAALESLVDTEVDVVNASIGFDNVWAGDGTSAPSEAVQALVDAGVIVTVAAGNEALKYRVGELSAVGDGRILLAGAVAARIPAPRGRARVSLRWEEPFAAAHTDLDLLIVNADTGAECGRSEAPQDGDDPPREAVDTNGCSESVLAIVTAEPGVNPAGLRGWLYSPNGIEADGRTLAASLSIPGDAAGALTVGAWLTDTDEVAAWSSRGPTDDLRLKPDVVGPAGVSTRVWGDRSFSGSSAATPHAAGLAALWVQSEGHPRDPEAFADWARAGATDGGAPGPDPVWGWGALSAGAAPEGCACGGSGAGLAWWPAAALAALVRGRRCSHGAGVHVPFAPEAHAPAHAGEGAES